MPQVLLASRRVITYCYRCLVLNPSDVFSPYWRRAWAGGSTSLCQAHDDWVGRLSPADMAWQNSRLDLDLTPGTVPARPTPRGTRQLQQRPLLETAMREV